MHESDRDLVLEELRKVNENLERIAETQMMVFIQMSRLYDVFVVSAFQDESGLEDLMNLHEQGYIHTQAPVLRRDGFAQGYEDPIKTEDEE